MRRRFTKPLLLACWLGALVACTKRETAPAHPDAAAGVAKPGVMASTEAPAAPAAAPGINSVPAALPTVPVAVVASPGQAERGEPGAASSAPGSASPATNRALPADAAATTPAPDGAALFASTCATCHMADGSGVPFLQPSVRGSAWISSPDPQLLLSLILRGSAVLGEAAQAYDNDMAPQEHLTDAEIAAVATYVRTRFATPPVETPVTPAEVATARARPGLPE